MRRSVFLPMTLVLCVVTGLTLLQMAAVLAESRSLARPPDHDMARARAHVWVVEQFYAAVNDALRTGDATVIEAFVATEFTDHAPAPGLPSTRAGLVQQLRALHAAVPGAHLTVEDLHPAGELVMARVRLEGSEPESFLGVPLHGPVAPWGPFHVFRLADDRIVEHWGVSGDRMLLPLATTPLTVPPAHGSVLQLERLTLPPGTDRSLTPGPLRRVLLVDAGPVHAHVAGSAIVERAEAAASTDERPGVAAASDLRLHGGDVLVLPPGSSVTLRTEGETTGGVLMASLELAMEPVGAYVPSDGATTQADDALVEVVTRRRVPYAPTGPVVLAVGRARLAPGAGITLDGPDGLILLVVEDGQLRVTQEDGSLAASDAAGCTYQADEAVVLRAQSPDDDPAHLAELAAQGERLEVASEPCGDIPLSPGQRVAIEAVGDEELSFVMLTVMPAASNAPSVPN